MQAGPQTTEVNLIPVWTGNTFKKWNMSMGKGGPVHGPGHYPPVKVDPPSGATIKFTIINPKGIEFNSANPIYVRAGDAKPGHEVDSQFTYAVSDDGHNNQNAVLTVHDSNQAKGHYNYVLYFNDAGPFDPIIDNSGPHVIGGGQTYDSASYAWYAVGAVAIVVILVLAIRAMLRRT